MRTKNATQNATQNLTEGSRISSSDNNSPYPEGHSPGQRVWGILAQVLFDIRSHGGREGYKRSGHPASRQAWGGWIPSSVVMRTVIFTGASELSSFQWWQETQSWETSGGEQNEDILPSEN